MYHEGPRRIYEALISKTNSRPLVIFAARFYRRGICLLPAAKQQIPRRRDKAAASERQFFWAFFRLHRRVGSGIGAVLHETFSLVYLRALLRLTVCSYLFVRRKTRGVKFHDFAHVGQEIRETVVARIRVILMLHSL